MPHKRSSPPIWHEFFIATGFSPLCLPGAASGRLHHLQNRWRIGHRWCATARARFRAFHNVCRHRGSRICKTEQGSSHRLVCPYHRWTYELDGALVLDTSKEFGVAKSELSLRPVAIENAAGLLFISLADSPPDFSRSAGHHPAQDEAACAGARQDRPPDRLRGEGELEDRVREQSRVLPLPAPTTRNTTCGL